MAQATADPAHGDDIASKCHKSLLAPDPSLWRAGPTPPNPEHLVAGTAGPQLTFGGKEGRAF